MWAHKRLTAGRRGGSLLTAAVTWNSQALAEPRYDGLLALAPTVVGSAEEIVGNFETYSAQLARLVTNVSRLYQAGLTLPSYQATDDTVRVLSVSDIHLNPVAFDVIESVTRQFQTDFAVETGDFTDHGSEPEDRFTTLISRIDQPYVFVRGNHDSMRTQAAVTEVGQAFDERLRTTDEVDLALVHDPKAAAELDGQAPLVLAGHGHQREIQTLVEGTRVFEQGSTGGAGLRGLEGEESTPIQLSYCTSTPRPTNSRRGTTSTWAGSGSPPR